MALKAAQPHAVMLPAAPVRVKRSAALAAACCGAVHSSSGASCMLRSLAHGGYDYQPLLTASEGRGGVLGRTGRRRAIQGLPLRRGPVSSACAAVAAVAAVAGAVLADSRLAAAPPPRSVAPLALCCRDKSSLPPAAGRRMAPASSALCACVALSVGPCLTCWHACTHLFQGGNSSIFFLRT